MGRHCCVPLCTNDSSLKKVKEKAKTKDKITFHRLPKDEELRKKWIHNIRRDPGPKFHIQPYTSVCSVHFTPDDFKHSLTGRKLLKINAVPSVFRWTKTKTVQRKEITPMKPAQEPPRIIQTRVQPPAPTPAPYVDHVYASFGKAFRKDNNCENKIETASENCGRNNDASVEKTTTITTTLEQISHKHDTLDSQNADEIEKLKKEITELKKNQKSQQSIISKLLQVLFTKHSFSGQIS